GLRGTRAAGRANQRGPVARDRAGDRGVGGYHRERPALRSADGRSGSLIAETYFPARTREATLMYLRPASWAWSTASPSFSSSRTLASLISIGRLIPATTSTEPPFMQESARF